MTYSTPYNSWSWRLGWMESHSNSGRGLEFEGLFQPFFIGRKEISPHSCSDLELVGNRFRVTVQCRRGEVLEWCLLVKPWCQQVGHFHAKKRSLYSFVCLRHPWHLQGHFVSLEFWGSNSSNSQDYSEEWILKNFYHLATLPILDWDWKKGDDYPQHAKLCFPRPKETLATGVWLRPMWLFLSIALIYIIQLWKSLQGFLGTIFGSNYSVRTATTATTTTAAKQ